MQGLFSDETRRNPYPLYEQLRNASPVHTRQSIRSYAPSFRKPLPRAPSRISSHASGRSRASS